MIRGWGIEKYPNNQAFLERRLIVPADRDAQGRAFNAVFDMRRGTLSGRPADGDSGYGFKQLLTTLHKTHHFPMEFGSTFIWVLLADLTALLLLVWALTGLVMWYQLKKLRRIGAVLLAVSLVGAGALWLAMTDRVEFAGARGPRGPGG